MEEIENRIVNEARRASDELPFDYPFNIRPEGGIILSLRGGFAKNIFGASYLSMQLEMLYREGFAYFGDENDSNRKPESAFFNCYTRIFEVLSAIAVANLKGGTPILIGSSRSVAEALLPALEEVCRIIGRGGPKTMAQLNRTQQRANDGGVDAIIVVNNGCHVYESSYVSATIQRTDLRNKVMGPDRRRRVQNYFLDYTVLGPQTGMLTHSGQYDVGIYEICSEGDCGYLSREEILKRLYMGNITEKRKKRSVYKNLKEAGRQMEILSAFKFRDEFDLKVLSFF